MPPVPGRWKRRCQTGEAFNASTCNRSARDSLGHGTHTSSTAAGLYVTNMNYKGLAGEGERGRAPMARFAVYKTCWRNGCYDDDLLDAFDDAICDGVHILSMSLGPDTPEGEYFTDAILVGSFHDVSRGIIVVASVGNQGMPGSATNLSPWVIIVAASSTDREFKSDIILGNDAHYSGENLSVTELMPLQISFLLLKILLYTSLHTNPVTAWKFP